MKKHIPNTITCCNLISGAIATTFAFEGNYMMAIILICVGAVFDFFDGMSARLLHVSSSIGKELDSLADDITFGLAPSVILFMVLQEMRYPAFLAPVQAYLPYLAFIMAAFSALRLAKFNLDERQTTSFIGLPTPANALFWGSLVVGQHDFLVSIPNGAVWMLLGVFVFSYLLVAELPLFALKFKSLTWKDNWVKYVFLLGCIPCLVLLGYSSLSAIIVWYLVLAILTRGK